jgi:CTP:molybdopterin cytidylyltransferase MocA
MVGPGVFPLMPLLRRSPRGPGGALAPRVAPAAVRIPDPRQLSFDITFPAGYPRIFVHEGARQALERRLSQAYQRPVILSVTDNARRMISCSRRNGILTARIHHMFLDADPEVQDALVRYVVKSERNASMLVGRYIDDNGHRIRATRPMSGKVHTQGDHHDLLALFHKVNDRYFGGQVDALITWGRRVRRPARKPDAAARGRTGRIPPPDAPRSIKLGTYSATERLIRIHPVLDKPWVPRYFVSFVLYHEMLHHVMPATVVAGRRVLHPPIFQARERLFRDFERSIAWERRHLHRLLRAQSSGPAARPTSGNRS